MAYFREIPILPETGPLGQQKGQGYHPSNEEIIQNNYLQNQAINAIGHNMKEIILQVADHGTLIDELKAIRKYLMWFFRLIIWGVPVIGGAGLLAIWNWVNIHIHTVAPIASH